MLYLFHHGSKYVWKKVCSPLAVCAGDGSPGGDSGWWHGGRVLPSASGCRAFCTSVDLLYNGGDQQLRNLTGAHVYTHTDSGILNDPVVFLVMHYKFEAEQSHPFSEHCNVRATLSCHYWSNDWAHFPLCWVTSLWRRALDQWGSHKIHQTIHQNCLNEWILFCKNSQEDIAKSYPSSSLLYYFYDWAIITHANLVSLLIVC